MSYSLKSLESLIGQPLFIRSTRVIKLTETGKQLYESTYYAIENLSSAIELILESNKTPSGKLVINMAQDIYRVFLKEILCDFQREYPNIQLELTMSDTLDQHIVENIDVGFRYGETLNENMIAQPIHQYFPHVKIALFASKSYAEKYGLPHSLDALSLHSIVKFRLPTSKQLSPLQLRKANTPASEIVNISNISTAMVVNSSEVMLDMVLQGFGMGSLLSATVQEHFNSGELIPVLEQHWPDIPTIYMYYAQENKQTLKVTCFLDFVRKKMAEKR